MASERTTFIPIAAVAALAITSGLPLRWGPLYIAAAALVAITIAAVGSRSRMTSLVATASASIVLIGTIDLAYAAYALTHTGVFGPLNRLSYPFLVATGLRVNGGACLLMLCALVSVVPLALREAEEPISASERAHAVRVRELGERFLPGPHRDSH